MTICYFGIYDPNYSRNRIFIKGLRQNGAVVVECNSRRRGLAKYFDLISKHWKIRNDYDVMIVGFPGQQAMILARFLTRKPIIFNVLVSLYDSLVYDRKTVDLHSLGALYFWLIDFFSSLFATAVVLDTNTHADYFAKTFHLRRNKFHRIFIGSDNESIHPVPFRESDGEGKENFTLHFHGYFNPLQGVPVVLRAAKILEKENIKFNIIGRGQGYEAIRKLARDLDALNVRFIDPVPYDELKNYMARAEVALGIFGTTQKAGRVIPNKVFEAMSARMPVITSRTAAVEELLTDRKNVLFCDKGSSEDLAAKILELKNNKELRRKIAEEGHKLFREKLTPIILGKEVIALITKL